MPKQPNHRSLAKFYSSALDEAETLDFQVAAGMEGLDDEIALLRLQIKALFAEEGSPDLDQLIKATNALARLISTRYHTSKEDNKGIKEAIGNVLKEIAIPLGLGIAIKKL